MHYISTRNADHPVTLGEAIARGIAPDGGLYVPQEFPHFTTRQFETDLELPQIAARLLAPFAAGDPLAAELPAICNEAFDFPAPLVSLPNAPAPLSVLELFHGPTSAFKDFGARFLAASMERIRRGQRRKLTNWSQLRATPAAPSRPRFTASRGSTSSCCIRTAASPNCRRISLRAGVATYGRSPCAARSTIVSAS